ncbi:hypothetical protein GCM10008018_31740 [Paenibacillus marchantiophytorum]|uniref:Uncharacterized protein n=1 Tax=Paenibacillus marchantiophytorum TaxID=1619310 RepID=A0ABQ1ER10_9BACL|nr:hypothetical protein GCM10008018_31740 [Paenibacillus marchantiophytorum]
MLYGSFQSIFKLYRIFGDVSTMHLLSAFSPNFAVATNPPELGRAIRMIGWPMTYELESAPKREPFISILW